MPSLQEITEERLKALIEKGARVLATHTPNPPNVIGFPTLDSQIFNEWRTQALALLEGTVGKDSVYYKSFQDQVGSNSYTGGVQAGLGILNGLLEDVINGHLVSISNLVTAEVFTDFLDMAQHLIDKGYKDPAASLCGAVLEDGLRRLARNSNIKVRDKDDLSALNSKCAQGGLYNRLTQKKIQVWIDVRNSADHGKFSEYTADDVKSMLRGVSEFLAGALKP
jgi:hypothetical protein